MGDQSATWLVVLGALFFGLLFVLAISTSTPLIIAYIPLAISVGFFVLVLKLLSESFAISLAARRDSKELEIAKRQILKTVSRHKQDLVRVYRQKVYQGEYGELRFDSFDKEVKYFYKTIVLPKIAIRPEIMNLPEVSQFGLSAIYAVVSEAKNLKAPSNVVPNNPIEFENWVADVLAQNGWVTRTSRKSGDQGLDVEAIYRDHKCIIQCKLHEAAVGNKAVQEVASARKYFDGHSAVVVGKSGYTRSARQLAEKNDVLLIDASELPKLSMMLGLPECPLL